MYLAQPFYLQKIIAPRSKFSIIEKSCSGKAQHLQNIAAPMQLFAQTFNEIT
tara:strand:- start:2615 stop:2770 length:156 start_codon:yes stop_codon:yes gene_type:complete